MATEEKEIPQVVVGLDRRMLEDGSEKGSPISRTVTVHLPSMGERIRRYLKSPQSQQSLYDDPSNWDDEDQEAFFDENGLRHSFAVHEDRYQEGLKEAKKRQNDRENEAKVKAEKEENERKEARRKEIRELIKEGSTPENIADNTSV